MCEPFDFLLQAIEKRWPLTNKALVILRDPYIVAGFDVCIVLNSRQLFGISDLSELKDRMDAFEEQYSSLGRRHFKTWHSYPNISSNFDTFIKRIKSKKTGSWKKRLHYVFGDVEIKLGLRRGRIRYRICANLEIYLAWVTQKRHALKPLPLPIRDAIDYHL